MTTRGTAGAEGQASAPHAPSGPVAARVGPYTREGDFGWVADLLAGHRDEILGRWLECATEQPFHAGRREQSVADHIPPLFDALVDLLRRNAPPGVGPGDPLADPAVLNAAREHARARFQQGLGAPDVAVEFRILRQEIGRTLRLHLADSTPTRDVVSGELLVHDALDGAVFLALSALDQHEAERRRVEQALLQSEERFRLLVEAVEDYAIFLMDADGRVATWNPGAQRIKGYTAQQILGQPYSIFFSEQDRRAGRPEELLSQTAERGRVQTEGWRVRKDGSRFWADAVLTALRGEDGSLRGFAKVTRDMTERREAELERERLLEAERAARARAEAALLLRDEVLAAVSHDLRTPLAAIAATSQLLARRVAREGESLEPARLLEGLDRIREAAGRMATMMDELLDAAHLQLGQPLELHRQRLDLVALAADAVADHQAETDRCQVRMEADVPHLWGSWDYARLRRLLDNLLSNAIKYSPDGGLVLVRVSRADEPDGSWAVLQVRDQGVGIPAGDLAHVFERFHRGSNVAAVAPGTGLGLAGARQIVQQHEGSVNVESTEGRGSTFTVRLPLADRGAAGAVARP